ncbi:hypothetical protein EDC44_10919 [Cricetibacter osteomyelitidis]|uniref:Uncharacterized protein n=1 Tax=Cricetibacter osteomyelitidis TaxID=1521931 RepID=A0A4R2TDU5_9PAST|nr:hypothetical protein [Cricetibacter osteomyelitidis]TCP95328.1 hypothetical protein EDC44_10919 [Cricetibacter osteomyelitidis]
MKPTNPKEALNQWKANHKASTGNVPKTEAKITQNTQKPPYFTQLDYRFFKVQYENWNVRAENLHHVKQLGKECDTLADTLKKGLVMLKELNRLQPKQSISQEQKDDYNAITHALRYLSAKFDKLGENAKQAKAIKTEAIAENR